jgi:hypothetical protein
MHAGKERGPATTGNKPNNAPCSEASAVAAWSKLRRRPSLLSESTSLP